LILGAVVHRAEADATLTVCVDEANPTMAMDVRVARAVAESQGSRVKFVKFLGYGKGGEGLSPRRFSKMAESDCELIMGFPVDVSNPNVPEDLRATSAYAATGFVLVNRRDSRNTSLGDLPKGSEVGIAALDTYAGLLLANHPNLVMHVYPKDSLMLDDLSARRIAAGIAWQPAIASRESRRPGLGPLRVTPIPGEHMRWDLVALFGARSQQSADLFNRGISVLKERRRLEALIAPYDPAAAVLRNAGPRNAMLRDAVLRDAVLRDAVLRVPRNAVLRDADSSGWVKVADIERAADTARVAKRPRRATPALYTQKQAASGALAYYQNCAMCHGPELNGQAGGYSGPALKGKEFADPSYNFHISDIFNFVAKLMPAATPGSLTHEQDVEIMAFILQQNGYPPGELELVYEAAEKSMIPLRYYGK
jgi:mono/diheme cytochrome c family protein